MLVAIGAALAMLLGLQFARTYGAAAPPGIRVDPTRVAYGVMTGIGFLGAGAIISHGAGVRGLTTAASLWCTAAVGLAAGLGLYELAACATLIVLIVLYLLSRIDRRIPSRWYKTVTLTMDAGSPSGPAEIRQALVSNHIEVADWGFSRDAQTGRQTATLDVSSARRSPDDLWRIVSALEGVQSLSIA
jgi:putative Mg2+ transporter-C (MgtC) family protein